MRKQSASSSKKTKVVCQRWYVARFATNLRQDEKTILSGEVGKDDHQAIFVDLISCVFQFVLCGFRSTIRCNPTGWRNRSDSISICRTIRPNVGGSRYFRTVCGAVYFRGIV